jgi:hypothetical protein
VWFQIHFECRVGEVIDGPDIVVSDLESIIEQYCLFLMFILNKEWDFRKEYDIIYDDWGECNELGGRELPHVYVILLRDNVFSNN